jgi:hypothetical protein
VVDYAFVIDRGMPGVREEVVIAEPDTLKIVAIIDV